MLCEDYIVRNTSNGEGPSNQPEPSRIVLADDHPAFRAALRQLVTLRDPTLEVVAEAGDGQEALEACRHFGPDLILMDLSMPKVGGIEATRAIKREMPRTVVLVLTAHEDPELLAGAIKAGAAGYVLKTASLRQIQGAIRRALAGESPLNQEVAMRLLVRVMEAEAAREMEDGRKPAVANPDAPAGPSEDAPSSLIGSLTAREKEILRFVAEGHTNQQIARSLLISTSTVKNHIRAILSKLGVSDRTQAAVLGIRAGMFVKESEE
jgi:DNA-binding NarL/FixJ family response regulator